MRPMRRGYSSADAIGPCYVVRRTCRTRALDEPAHPLVRHHCIGVRVAHLEFVRVAAIETDDFHRNSPRFRERRTIGLDGSSHQLRSLRAAER
jgi:hypothetical protein